MLSEFNGNICLEITFYSSEITIQFSLIFFQRKTKDIVLPLDNAAEGGSSAHKHKWRFLRPPSELK